MVERFFFPQLYFPNTIKGQIIELEEWANKCPLKGSILNKLITKQLSDIEDG